MSYIKQDTSSLTAVAETELRRRLRFYDRDGINWIKLPEHSNVITVLTSDIHTGIELGEYADYIDIRPGESLEDAAKKIGLGCACAFNALVGKAMRDYGKGVYVTDLFENNVRLNIVQNDQPSIADPLGIIPGWAAFRFLFGAGRPGTVK